MPPSLSLSEQLVHCTVRIEVESSNGAKGTGTGFFYRFAVRGDKHVPAIVTNKHVVEAAQRGRFHVTLADDEGNPNYGHPEIYSFDRFSQFWVPHPDAEIDLCAMPIAPLLMAAESAKKRPFYIPIDRNLIPTESKLADMTAMEDITMVGYPNGIWDEKHNMPALRRGVTGTQIVRVGRPLRSKIEARNTVIEMRSPGRTTAPLTIHWSERLPEGLRRAAWSGVRFSAPNPCS